MLQNPHELHAKPILHTLQISQRPADCETSVDRQTHQPIVRIRHSLQPQFLALARQHPASTIDRTRVAPSTPGARLLQPNISSSRVRHRVLLPLRRLSPDAIRIAVLRTLSEDRRVLRAHTGTHSPPLDRRNIEVILSPPLELLEVHVIVHTRRRSASGSHITAVSKRGTEGV